MRFQSTSFTGENDDYTQADCCEACGFLGCSPSCVLCPYPADVEDAIVEAMLASFTADMTADMMIGEPIDLDTDT